MLLIRFKKYSLLILLLYLDFLIAAQIPHIADTTTNSLRSLVLPSLSIEFLLVEAIVFLLEHFPARWGIDFLIICIGLFVLSGFLFGFGRVNFAKRYSRVIYFGIPSFLIISASVKFELVTKNNINSLFLKLGDASYSIYLFYLPLIVAFLKIMAKLNLINYVLFI